MPSARPRCRCSGGLRHTCPSSGYTALGASQQNPLVLYMVREQKFGVSNDGGVTWAVRSAVDDMQTMRSFAGQ